MRSSRNAGFSLLEVAITLVILMSLTMAVASMLRNGFDIKAGLSERARLNHTLSVAISKMSSDIEHAFFVSARDTAKNGIGRNMKTVFRTEKNSAGDKLALTTKTHRPIIAGAFESDLTYVVYEVLDAKDAPGRKHLYRGESPYIPGDLRDDPPMRLLARNIKSLTIEPWNGEAFTKDYWDTGRGDTRNRLPKMVRLTIEGWLHDRVQDDGQDESVDQETDKVQTVIYLSDSWEYEELKTQVSTVRWSNL